MLREWVRFWCHPLSYLRSHGAALGSLAFVVACGFYAYSLLESFRDNERAVHGLEVRISTADSLLKVIIGNGRKD